MGGIYRFSFFRPIFFLRFVLSKHIPLLKTPRFLTGSPLSFYIGNREKIGFPMPAAENGFKILNVHPKIYRNTKKKLMDIYPNFTFLNKKIMFYSYCRIAIYFHLLVHNYTLLSYKLCIASRNVIKNCKQQLHLLLQTQTRSFHIEMQTR